MSEHSQALESMLRAQYSHDPRTDERHTSPFQLKIGRMPRHYTSVSHSPSSNNFLVGRLLAIDSDARYQRVVAVYSIQYTKWALRLSTLVLS